MEFHILPGFIPTGCTPLSLLSRENGRKADMARLTPIYICVNWTSLKNCNRFEAIFLNVRERERERLAHLCVAYSMFHEIRSKNFFLNRHSDRYYLVNDLKEKKGPRDAFCRSATLPQ